MDMSDFNNGYGLNDEQIKHIAAAVYGENRGQGDDALKATAASFFNRMGEHEWKKQSVDNLAYHTFNAIKDSVSGKNTGYLDALSGKFPDKDGENEYKKIISMVGAMNRGKMDTGDAQFYFNDNEIKKLKASKNFDFAKVDEGDSFKAGGQKFRTFHYKKS